MRYNITITEVESNTVTELKNASIRMILKTFKSLNKNTLIPQPMRVSKKRAHIPKDKYDASIDEEIGALIKNFE